MKIKGLTVGIFGFCTLHLLCGCMNTYVETNYFSFQIKGVHRVSVEDRYIIFDNIDTIFYNRGFYINTLTEEDPEVVYIPMMSDKDEEIKLLSRIDSIPNTEISRDMRFDLDKYRKQNVSFIPVNGYEAKLTYPRMAEGILGIYIDSLYYGCIGDVCGNIEFNIYGVNIRPTMHRLYIKAFRNIELTTSLDSPELPLR